MKNYTFIKEKYIEEIDSNVKIYKHNKSGARICTMENDDDNKVFSIAFRTPPINNCGLTHILEHSVLCGSKKYPVKDPFVALMKSSLNTFINAFTFADKTMYPVASLNDKDFKNLMGVYMDAVFYPNIYKYKEIFLQEGWHYELKNEADPIKINGVVYNEMKGAFSNPQETHSRRIMNSLFPDTAYGLESGGDPDYIPELSYEEFLNFHKMYYSPSNSYIYIYGNCNMEERLEWLDKEYLSKFDVCDFDTRLKKQPRFNIPKYETYYYQTDSDLNNKTYLSYNTLFPSVLNTKEVIAANIILDALFNIPGAKLKEKLQMAGIGSSVSAGFDPEVYEPYLSIKVQGSNEDKEELFIKIIDDYLKELLEKGLDKDTLMSLINHTEFENREKLFSASFPKGLMIEISALTLWLYDDNEPFKGLETIEIYKELKNDLLNTNYFENIIDKYILNNPHKTFVKLVPSLDYQKNKDLSLEKKLESYKNSLSKDELNDLIKLNKDLEAYQSEESTLEELATLPKLSIDDLDKNPKEYKLEEINDKYKILYSNYHTNEIAYVRYLFDITKICNIDLNYLELFNRLAKQLNTKNHSYFEINQIILNELGNIAFDTINLTTIDGVAKCYEVLLFSCLNEKINTAKELVLDVLFNTKFDDFDRIYKRLGEIKNSLENGIVSRGHAVALYRSLSNINEQFNYKENVIGISFLDFITDLYNNFESKKNEIKEKLENIKDMFAKSNLIVSIAGNETTYNLAKNATDSLFISLNEEAIINKQEFVKKPKIEAIKTSYNVNYVARSGSFSEKYNNASSVLENALSLDYLWQNVRVLGGAYGCMMQVIPNGLIGFTSYRDPNIDRTNDAYLNIVDYILNMDPSEEELLEFKIGAIGNSQIVEHVRHMSETALTLYLKGATYEYRKKNRLELLNATKEDLKKMVSWYKEALFLDNICVLGNSKAIDDSKLKYDEIRNLIK